MLAVTATSGPTYVVTSTTAYPPTRRGPPQAGARRAGGWPGGPGGLSPRTSRATRRRRVLAEPADGRGSRGVAPPDLMERVAAGAGAGGVRVVDREALLL